MDITFWLLLPAILVFGVVTSIYDYREGKIRNKHIMAALAYSFFVFITIFVSSLFGIGVNYSYLVDYAMNLFFALFSGFLIWYVGMWSAGDAKLFLAYAALLPLSVYSYGYLPGFPSFVILINTFVPLLGYFLLTVLRQKNGMVVTNLRKLKKPKLEAKRIAFVPLMFVSFFGISFVTNLITAFTGISFDVFSNAFLILVIYLLLERVMPIHLLGIALSAARLVFDPNIFSPQFLVMFLANSIIFIIMKSLVDFSHDVLTTSVKIENLAPGMIPAEIVYKEGDEYKKKPLTFSTLFMTFRDRRNLKPIFEQELTLRDIDRIKKLHSGGLFKPHEIRIQQMVPFAAFMFFGVLLTIMAQGNFLVIFLKLLQ